MVTVLADAKQALVAYEMDRAKVWTGPRAATVRAHLTAIGSAAAELTKALKAIDPRTAELLKKEAGPPQQIHLPNGIAASELCTCSCMT